MGVGVRGSLAAFAVLVLIAGACGGVENEPNLAKAAEQTEALGSTRFEFRTVETEDGKRIDVICEGAADYTRERIRIRCDYGGKSEFELVGIGADVYLRGEVLGFGGDEGKWVKMTGSIDDSPIHDLSPQGLLSMLRDASSETSRVGEDDVRGVSTVRYRLTVDCNEVRLSCEGTGPIEVWLDRDGLVRRIALNDNETSGTMEFFDFGAEVDIELPPADQVVEEDTVSGASGSGSGMSVSPPAPCYESQAKPISERKALATLREHGFSVSSDRSGYCIEGVAAVLENAQVDFDRQGRLSCFLRARSARDAPETVLRRGVDGGDAELSLANLRCMILADSPNAEEKIDPLEAAFDDLRRAIQP